MLNLIIIVVFGLVFAYFATLNTSLVQINLSNSFLSVPLYVLVLGSILIGLLISGIINALNLFSSSIALHSKDSKIKQKEQTVEELSHKLHHLEVENARLKGSTEVVVRKDIPQEESKVRQFFRKVGYHTTH